MGCQEATPPSRTGMSVYVSILIKSSESCNCSPSAAVQWAGFSAAPSCSTVTSTVTCDVASSRTWSEGWWGSGPGAIPSSIAPSYDGSWVAMGSGSPSAVGLGWCSANRGDGGLGLWVRSGAGVVICDVHSKQQSTGHQHPLNEGGKSLSRTVPRQLRSCGGVQSSLIKQAEAAVQVVCKVDEKHKVTTF